MIYLWTEDREEKSGYRFWKMIAGMLFGDRITVESKRNNSELVKAVWNQPRCADIGASAQRGFDVFIYRDIRPADGA